MPYPTHVGFQDLCSSSKQGTPKLLRTSDCDFVFEWETPLVCPDEVKTEGCSLTDEQLYYSFNLSSLSKSTFKVMPLAGSLAAVAWILIATCVLANMTSVTTGGCVVTDSA